MSPWKELAVGRIEPPTRPSNKIMNDLLTCHFILGVGMLDTIQRIAFGHMLATRAMATDSFSSSQPWSRGGGDAGGDPWCWPLGGPGHQAYCKPLNQQNRTTFVLAYQQPCLLPSRLMDVTDSPVRKCICHGASQFTWQSYE